MVNSCCCYVIDSGYLFPTLLSAIQARQATTVERTDIKIICVGHPTDKTCLFQEICEGCGIQLVLVAPEGIDNMPIMFARFFLCRFLDLHYEAVVYLDADTQISETLEPLLDVPLQPGRFLAARDPMSVLIDTPARAWRQRRAYFRSIGIPEQVLHRYCNSGVLRFNRKDWADISRTALGASSNHGHALKFPDQDALNIIFGADYLTMSYKWNFPIFFLNCDFQDFITPRIYHFMSNPRPWDGPFHPWGQKWHTPYLRLIETYPQLIDSHRALSRLNYLKYVVQQRVKYVLESPLWRTPNVRERVLRSESEAYI